MDLEITTTSLTKTPRAFIGTGPLMGVSSLLLSEARKAADLICRKVQGSWSQEAEHIPPER